VTPHRPIAVTKLLAALAAAVPLVPGIAAGQWVEAPGQGWVSASIYHQDTRQRYDSRGDERALFADGHAITSSLYVTAAFGVISGVDIWTQMPIHRLRFDDAAGSRDRTGIGDPRVWVRVAPLRLLGSSFPLAVRAGVKLPAGDFPVDAEIIPLGEAQRDWEVLVEVGHSFHPLPVYAMAWVGYRWRERDDEAERDWGDERFFLAQVGGTVGRIGYKVIAEGWDGLTPVLEGILTPTAERAYAQVMPMLTYPIGRGQLEAGVRVPLYGRNLPSGQALVLGYFFDWSL